jgi:hypothetical protein
MAFIGNDLPEPMEFLELEHGHSIVLSITRYEVGTTQIHPKQISPKHIRDHMQQNALTETPTPGTPITVRIPVLRVWGSRLDAASPNLYWDISSKRLTAQLEPRLYAAAGAPVTVTITANGIRPSKLFSVEMGA